MNHMTTQLGGGWGTICLIECVTEGGRSKCLLPDKTQSLQFYESSQPPELE